MTQLLERYNTSVQSALGEELAIKNSLAIPRLQKVIVNVGTGDIKGDQPLEKMISDGLAQITGQKPVPTRSKKSIAGFKLREGDHIGFRVTLRGDRMYDFLDRMITYVFPRLRDFQGVALSGFDGHGNYSFGFREQTAFPEIPYEGTGRTWGLQVTIVTSSKDDAGAKALLEKLGFPFAKPREDK